MRTIEQMIQSEVLCCMSSIVSQLAGAYGQPTADSIMETVNQAFELACPVQDYEEAATQAGWTGPHTDDYGATFFKDATDGQTWTTGCWERLCGDFDIEPYDREVFEHWAVTDWFADKLIAKGEKVDKDFAGLCIWARTTSGQMIQADSVIEAIYAEMMAA